MWTYVRLGLLWTVVVLALGSSAETGATPGATELVSVNSAGQQGTGDSGAWGRPAISANGRYVAFESFAANLVTDDTNNRADIFFRDRQASTTTRVSLGNTGNQANGSSFQPAISGDGRYVAFESDATNLVSGDTNAANDVFVRDRQAAGSTTRVSVATGGAEANGASYQPAMSSDGRYVAFHSEATNLVSGDTNGATDVFVRDRDTDVDGIFDESGAVSTTRVSVDSAGAEANGASSQASVSSDGRYVAFESEATNLVSGDTNNAVDVFVRDRDTDGNGIFDEAGAVSTTRMSVSSGGAQGDGGSGGPAIDWNGRYVAFSSTAANLVAGDSNGAADVFVRDRQAGSTTRVSVSSGGAEANGASYDPAVSWDGRYIAFSSTSTNLVSGDTNGADDVFVRDRDTDADGIFDELGAVSTTRVSVDGAGVQGDAESSSPAISADGRYAAFYSYAGNLVSGDANGRRDVFVHDRSAPVGGIAELPDISGRPAPDYTALAGLAAAALAALTAGAWYARRRFGWRRLR